jgi:hypothetical protein
MRVIAAWYYVVLTTTPKPLTGAFAFRRILRTDVRVLPIQIEHHWRD